MRPWSIRKLLVGIAVLTALGVVGGRAVKELRVKSQLKADLSSCTNHVIFLGMLIQAHGETAETFPDTEDAIEACAEMGLAHGYGPGVWWIDLACPESRAADDSFGYVFVADGLSTAAVVEHDALVLFCPASNHRGANHAHAVKGARGFCYLSSESERVAILERALKQAESGEVPYSAGAVARMKNDLAMRE